ncbi:MAG: 50S ribosomal protein L21 [Anaerobiospirillum succiniciproducens]|uniref:50S ribosomal protein L21 n=1 Tax=Anaerobiospirillum succiniciproducens TaxID=13335 RepID=UPI0004035EB2|nr:50S ribosomal protein L21 [Anaerobiospirillum succiniciproducens]MCI6863957.1 50S ribosomal protein L21 [Anaerobiospirillum succiniciproducens]MDO4676253.1 50S ribosomal protein L21 [Anaerobiospirillum succiniciproducens]MDY2798112.1 50S ribosomal protein L21 [Anaerobiospirillum succiniciproducens]
MYAVIFCGGKQHKVVEGEKLRVELLNKEQGSTVELDKVLLISDGTNVKVGTPYIDGAKVTATVLGEVAGEKVKIVKFRRRKHHQKVTGHRQWFTEIQITGIAG